MTNGARPLVEVLYRDAHVAVVNKPAGVASHRGWADDDDALLQLARDTLGTFVYLLHRLDRGASGAVAFALDPGSARTVSEAFAAGETDKRYYAITRGHPPAHVVIDHPIPKREDGPRVPAVTEVWCQDTFGRYAWIEARPQTGRLHQIRRHLKHISCPLIGDVKYGKGEHNRLFRTAHNLHRLALHAHHLEFPHPVTGARVIVDAPVPADLLEAKLSAQTAALTAPLPPAH